MYVNLYLSHFTRTNELQEEYKHFTRIETTFDSIPTQSGDNDNKIRSRCDGNQ